MRWPRLSPVQWGAILGTVYGLLFRLAMFFGKTGVRLPNEPVLIAGMGISFLFLVPLAMGALTVSWLPRTELTVWRMIFAPWAPVAASVTVTALLGWEGSICILMASPVLFGMSSVGGLLMGLSLRNMSSMKCNAVLTVLLLAPAVLGPVESRSEAPPRLETVETSIAIHASPETIWKNIKRVPAIQPGEHRPSWFHRLGFPRPIEATLSREGVGGIRHASFEGQLVFIETVTEWKENDSLAFSIHADPATIPPTTLDEHVTIGGPYFDVLSGHYWLEPRGPKDVILHLSSTHRLLTRFNFYAGFWSRLVMTDIQQYILEIIQARCQSATG